MRADHVVIAVRGERLAFGPRGAEHRRLDPGAPRDEFLQVYGVSDEGRMAALQVWFDLDDMAAALAELDARSTLDPRRRITGATPRVNAASR